MRCLSKGQHAQTIALIAAYDWWYDHDKPDPTRFGVTMTTGTQTVCLDDPSTVVNHTPPRPDRGLASGPDD